MFGNVTIIKTGYYSDRLNFICKNLKRIRRIKKIQYLDYRKIEKIDKNSDWVFYCPTETSIGLHIPIKEI